MLKKNGFTLAEVLICIGILGVIAAISLPALQSNVEKQKVGPALMKAINTLEVSSSLALQQNGVRTLDQIVKEDENKGKIFGEILKNHARFVNIPNSVDYAEVSGVEDYTYTTKDGIFFMADETKAPTDASTPTRAYSGKVYVVYVDINGIKPPNTIGKDVFLLWLDTKGVVIPYGSLFYGEYALSPDTWEVVCANKPVFKEPPIEPAACTGSIVDNGGRVLYNYEAITTKVKENSATAQPY